MPLVNHAFARVTPAIFVKTPLFGRGQDGLPKALFFGPRQFGPKNEETTRFKNKNQSGKGPQRSAKCIASQMPCRSRFRIDIDWDECLCIHA